MTKNYLYLLAIVFTTCIHSQETYIDNFETVSYANNDGTLNWSGNWVEIEPFATDNDPAGGFIAILSNQLDFNWIWSESISRTADLSAASGATLSFDWETQSLEAGEEMSIQVSADGVSFTTLATFGGATTGTFSQNISSFISANTTIRFINENNNWTDAGDVFIADSITISVILRDEAPVIAVTGNQNFCPSPTNSIPVVETVSITDADDTDLDQLTVQISTGYQNGQDLLTLTGTHPNITDTWNVVEGRLTLTGPATLAEFEAAVLAVNFSTSSPTVGGLREFSIVLGTPLFLPETGHYYEFIPALDIRWDDARDEAALRTFFGFQGYLVTLTSAIEANFAGGQITGTGWIGASDNFGSGEGEWRWETGPEAGTVFWNGDQNGSVVPGEFEFWNTGEPNDCCSGTDGEENYAHITDNTVGVENSWNDLPITGGGGAFRAQGYIVEYGGLPGDPVLQISGVTRITVACSVLTNRKITYRIRQ